MVGFGTVLGSGCTSGHGVCGLGRRSRRSLIAVIIFVGAGMVTVLIASLMPPAKWWGKLLFEGLEGLFHR